jgi:hypothetical protein
VILLDTHAAVWLASDDPALGPVCFHCGAMKRYVGKLKGKSTCIGLYRCYACRKPFTVKMGTTARDRGSPHGLRGVAGGLASFYA